MLFSAIPVLIDFVFALGPGKRASTSASTSTSDVQSQTQPKSFEYL